MARPNFVGMPAAAPGGGTRTCPTEASGHDPGRRVPARCGRPTTMSTEPPDEDRALSRTRTATEADLAVDGGRRSGARTRRTRGGPDDADPRRPRSRPGQPHRRVHRHQRWLRAPRGDRPRGPDRRPPTTTGGSGLSSRRPATGASSTWTAIGADAGRWLDYVAGTAREMEAAGLPDPGVRRRARSSLPSGSGLSSSAALELAAAWALAGPGRRRRTRSRSPGSPSAPRTTTSACICGLMDQFASAGGATGPRVLLDCRSLEHRVVPLPSSVVARGRPHRAAAHPGDERVQRAARPTASGPCGSSPGGSPAVRSLRDVIRAMLERHADRPRRGRLPSARHVVGENDRVLAVEDRARRRRPRGRGPALRREPRVAARRLRGQLTGARRARGDRGEVPGVVASRMTGAGFGGCTVRVVRPEAVDRLRASDPGGIPGRTGRTPRVWEVRAAYGAGAVAA